MTRATGKADLPLHGGRVPPWLADRMTALGRVISEAIVHHYGQDELLRRLSHPFWFQSFGAVMGMDWHSSGITTSVVGALKRGLAPLQGELGIYVCGGRGPHGRQTPAELQRVGEQTGLDGAALAHSSRLVAKVDSAAVQDGFDLYLHAFFVTGSGKWCVVQQGMNPALGQARRYHWLSEDVGSFLDSPHTAIEGEPCGIIVNLAHNLAEPNRQAALHLAQAGPDRTIAMLKRLREVPTAPRSLELDFGVEPLPHLRMPAHHDVRASDVQLRRLHGVLAAAADRGPKDFTTLMLSPGVGQRTLAALALVAEVIHGAPARFSDPARFSLALGGKDGHPFPVPLRVYDETLRLLGSAVNRAKIGQAERLAAIRRLDTQARLLEKVATGPTIEEFIARERAASPQLGGRTVHGYCTTLR